MSKRSFFSMTEFTTTPKDKTLATEEDRNRPVNIMPILKVEMIGNIKRIHVKLK